MQLTYLTGYFKLLTFTVLRIKQIVIGDFNLTPDNKNMREFVDLYNLISLIKTITFLKEHASEVQVIERFQKLNVVLNE